MARLAEDELRHAELAWAVDAWGRPRLTEPQQQELDWAREEAIAELEASPPATQELAELVGLPPMPVHHQLLAAARQELWR